MASVAPNLFQNQAVLRNLLHFVSQPLTTLHCALECSVVQSDAGGSEDVILALEQTDKVIEAVRLMREYLEAEEGCCSAATASVSSAIERVLHQLSVVAEARSVRLFACGASGAVIRMRDAWLQRALLYLVGTLVESEPAGGAIAIVLEDHASLSILSGHSLSDKSSQDRAGGLFPASETLRHVKLAIAQRVFESSGATMELHLDDKPGFTIRIPRSGSALSYISA